MILGTRSAFSCCCSPDDFLFESHTRPTPLRSPSHGGHTHTLARSQERDLFASGSAAASVIDLMTARTLASVDQ